MKKESLIAIKHYISILKSYFPFVNFEERRFICDLRREMIEYAKDNPFVTYEKLLEEYGSPEDIAEEYIYIQSNDLFSEYLKKKELWKFIIRSFLGFLLVCFIIFCVALYKSYSLSADSVIEDCFVQTEKIEDIPEED